MAQAGKIIFTEYEQETDKLVEFRRRFIEIYGRLVTDFTPSTQQDLETLCVVLYQVSTNTNLDSDNLYERLINKIYEHKGLIRTTTAVSFLLKSTKRIPFFSYSKSSKFENVYLRILEILRDQLTVNWSTLDSEANHERQATLARSMLVFLRKCDLWRDAGGSNDYRHVYLEVMNHFEQVAQYCHDERFQLNILNLTKEMLRANGPTDFQREAAEKLFNISTQRIQRKKQITLEWALMLCEQF